MYIKNYSCVSCLEAEAEGLLLETSQGCTVHLGAAWDTEGGAFLKKKKKVARDLGRWFGG